MDWSNDSAPLVSLAATVGLLFVTFWYARTTKEMAKESARAASAAEKAATAARDAATVAQSQIKPSFKGRLILVWDDDVSEHIPSIKIDSAGDAVVVQRVRIRRAFRRASSTERNKSELLGEELVPIDADWELPKRLHSGEALLLTHPALDVESEWGALDPDRREPFRRLLLDIDYTFSTDQDSPGGTRQLIVDADDDS
ncbi:hypothetical protein EXE59_02965 [Nocardioides eburneiflavus]|uniref:Uncharacterized protein n=1 Tax=Nocardioides eburneiflavus TaxID=2518372 RepID=A0A4Z1CD46_9ACTN|nr:hypothetical protein [Nocardioides eburneiflavus]TGN63018.1 hypothetical protein EXE59_02965 [Nocardioides eburneiflavus]